MAIPVLSARRAERNPWGLYLLPPQSKITIADPGIVISRTPSPATPNNQTETTMKTETKSETEAPEGDRPEGLAETHCSACGTPLGINPEDGQLGCPHIACCNIDKPNVRMSEGADK
jgi:hypothetical protein